MTDRQKLWKNVCSARKILDELPEVPLEGTKEFFDAVHSYMDVKNKYIDCNEENQ